MALSEAVVSASSGGANRVDQGGKNEKFQLMCLEARSIFLTDLRTSFSKIITHRVFSEEKEISFLRTCKSIQKGIL